jgi:hypothetical protein
LYCLHCLHYLHCWMQIDDTLGDAVEGVSTPHGRHGGTRRGIAFLTDYSVVDRIISHIKLKFVADKPPPPSRAYQEVMIATEAGSEYFL